MIAQELNPEVAAQQLGHTSSEITRRFYISKPDLAADASALLERLGKAPGAVGTDDGRPPQEGADDRIKGE
ncbi:hypothetical protein GCM10007231_28160 [Nocardioides daphniae]|uniref:Tyr recombinase domain-containing protein n=1 Tax=Nocardioides daphniae TaxID=402297 RepID=A0ABQ1QHU3_9ACTN|nr:hypothetical protein GCM10007231_28160 [Nocardioides daphniae]